MSVNDARDPFSPSSDLGHPADVILRSSDLVDFYTHKTILSFASPVFANMFTLPQSVSEADPTRDGRPVVHLSESSEAVEKFLILCYPRFTNSDGLRDLDGVDGAYEAAGKYDIQGDFGRRSRTAYACRWGLEDLAKTAAMETLKFPRYVPKLSVPEFKFISAHQFQQLQDFHCDCSDMIVQMLKEIGRGANVDRWYKQRGSPLQVRQYQPWWNRPGHKDGCCSKESMPDWFSKHIERVQKSAALHPDAALASKSLSDIHSSLDFDCIECRTDAPDSLSLSAWSLERTATRAYKDILAQFSFVG
ncbi:hypothetical protein B0H14DRAFT_3598393 [Mycena olivaceomarginata]|nr:hypothetical protein B0H14DRAFT_3598393 [Mycena olivaceomarginata]